MKYKKYTKNGVTHVVSDNPRAKPAYLNSSTHSAFDAQMEALEKTGAEIIDVTEEKNTLRAKAEEQQALFEKKIALVEALLSGEDVTEDIEEIKSLEINIDSKK